MRAWFEAGHGAFCEKCEVEIESILHILRDCHAALKVWTRILLFLPDWISLRALHLKDLINANLNNLLLVGIGVRNSQR